jgi:uncharacterized damage-inducible protein DinB
MDRQMLAKWWGQAWNEGLWAAAWSRSLQGLTPEQAAWSPAPERHSIWQMVNHMAFWREHELGLLAGQPRASQEEIAAGNFAKPTEVSRQAWESTVARLERSQQAIAAALAEPSTNIDRLRYLLPHDCYHFGQISYLRALQGLPAID